MLCNGTHDVRFLYRLSTSCGKVRLPNIFAESASFFVRFFDVNIEEVQYLRIPTVCLSQLKLEPATEISHFDPRFDNHVVLIQAVGTPV